MEELRDRVAVVTGAASGIGLGLAARFAAEGMKVVLADTEEPALAAANERLRDTGANTLAVPTDVSEWESVEALANEAFDAFGAVHVLCNNAGVAHTGMALWELPLEAWRWVLGVNLWGVIHGVRAFVPRMLVQGDDGHVVNTASVAGLSTGESIYSLSKHGVVSLSEALYRQFAAARTKVSASVLCPGLVDTRIADSMRNRPARLGWEEPAMSEEQQQVADRQRQAVATGLPPAEVAEAVVEGIRQRRFYIVPTQPEFKDYIRQRADNVVNERNPDP